ncbi:MAG: hypothetical protein II821_05255 [Treponema sp.]|nr:hypothetical protein [Treponema sp.]
MRKSIILVDDHALLLNGIKNWIESHSDYTVKFLAGSVEECKEIQSQFGGGELSVDDFLAVVDISFKSSDSQMENSGFDIIKEFSALGIPCIAYSSHDSGGFVEHATSPAVGAKGIVSKTADESILLAAINSVANGGTYIQAELVTGLLELRAIIQNLAVPALQSVPFKTVINDLCEQFYEQSKIPCKFFVENGVSLDSFTTEQKHHILRIIQEALNNARTHAKAEETSVVIRRSEESIRIMIFDDGQGFDSAKYVVRGDTSSHFGMSGMEMRAKLLEGILTVNSSSDTGTEVRRTINAEEKNGYS